MSTVLIARANRKVTDAYEKLNMAYQSEQQKAAEARQKSAEAERQRGRAEANFVQARRAVDLLTDLITRHGQGTPGDPPCDNAFLIADPTEGFAVEAAGTHWVYQQLREVRALSTVSTVRGDWDRISRGLSALTMCSFSKALGKSCTILPFGSTVHTPT